MNKIIKFSPNRVWRTYQGGKLLDRIEGKSIPKDSSFPEDWIGSVVEAKNIGREHVVEGLASVVNQDGQSMLFRELIQQNTSYFLGDTEENNYTMDDIPLVKYLDSATRLHFQVHPTRRFAEQRLGLSRGKTEAYVILDIRDDITEPYIYAGFQRSPSRNQLKKWIEQQDIASIESCFDRIPVKPGDVFLLPGGMPHALGEGILMLEIMEPSDLAVRFEIERCGYVIPESARFMNRGIETALDVFNFEPVPNDQIDQVFRCNPKTLISNDDGSSLELLIGSEKTPCFTVKRANVERVFTRIELPLFIGVVTQGSGFVNFDGELIALKCWDRFFIPAAIHQFQYQSDSGMTILECSPGDSHCELPVTRI